MLIIQAVFGQKANDFKIDDCVVEKIIILPGAGFDALCNRTLRDYSFIIKNREAMFNDEHGCHCLLVTGEDRMDGVLVQVCDGSYYTAVVPGAQALVENNKYNGEITL